MGDELKIDEQMEGDWLDAKLRDDLPYIDDAGFTARVVRQLPLRRRARPSLRAFILLGAALLASVVSFLLAAPSVIGSAAFLTAMPPRTIWVLGLCITMLLMIGGMAAALAKARDSRP